MLLPGFGFPLGLMGGRFLESLTFLAKSESESSTITIPSATQAGDLILGSDRGVDSSGLPSDTRWSGFTFAGGQSGDNRRINAYFKVANAGDGGDSVSGINGSASDMKLMVVLRPSTPIISASLISFSTSTITDGNPSPVDATVNTTPSVAVGIYTTGSNTINPRTFTPNKDGEQVHSNDHTWIAWKLFNSNPQDVTVDMDDEGSVNHISAFSISLTI